MGAIPILDMGYDTAERLGILHLHVLHILHVLLAYRYHGICLRQTNECCVIEHSSNDSGSFDQPILSVHMEKPLKHNSTHQTSGNNDFEVC